MSSRGTSSVLSIEWTGKVKWSEMAVGWSMCCFVMLLVSPMYWTLRLLHCIIINEMRRRAGQVISYASLFVGREKSVWCGSICNERKRLVPSLWQRNAPEARGWGGAFLPCLALTSMSCRVLQRRYDRRAGEENAFRHRREERRMLRLLEMTWDIFGSSGLSVISNGIVSDSFLVEVSGALLREIWSTFSTAPSLTRRCLYPLFIRCVVRAPERVLKNPAVEQILLSRKAMLKGMDCLVWDGWQMIEGDTTVCLLLLRLH